MINKTYSGVLRTCGCGKVAEYYVAGGDVACNKISRCPTYEELKEALKAANLELFKLKAMKPPTEGGGDGNQ